MELCAYEKQWARYQVVFTQFRLLGSFSPQPWLRELKRRSPGGITTRVPDQEPTSLGHYKQVHLEAFSS